MIKESKYTISTHVYGLCSRLRVVFNFGDGDCGAGEIHTRARKFEETRREGSAENYLALPSRRVSSKFRTRVCTSSAPQSPSPKLETTRSLFVQRTTERDYVRVMKPASG